MGEIGAENGAECLSEALRRPASVPGTDTRKL